LTLLETTLGVLFGLLQAYEEAEVQTLQALLHKGQELLQFDPKTGIELYIWEIHPVTKGPVIT